jgi:hypothetical protein
MGKLGELLGWIIGLIVKNTISGVSDEVRKNNISKPVKSSVDNSTLLGGSKRMQR